MARACVRSDLLAGNHCAQGCIARAGLHRRRRAAATASGRPGGEGGETGLGGLAISICLGQLGLRGSQLLGRGAGVEQVEVSPGSLLASLQRCQVMLGRGGIGARGFQPGGSLGALGARRAASS